MKVSTIGSTLLALAACLVSLFLMNRVLTLEARVQSLQSSFSHEKEYQLKERVEMLESK